MDSELNFNTGRKAYSRIGLSLFFLLLITTLIQLLLSSVLAAANIDLGSNSWLNYAVTLLPIYLISFPIFLLMTNNLDSEKPENKIIKPVHLVMYAIMCLPLMYVGNLIGLGLTSILRILFDLPATHSLQALVQNSDPLSTFVFVAILAPVVEEIIFRKIIIDKTIKYGSTLSVFISALFFGLFHGNFYQFFYAFLLGLLFAYIYVISGRLKYVIALHMLINFLGSVIAPFLLNLIDMEVLEQIGQTDDPQRILEIAGDSLIGLFLFGAYIMFIIVMNLVGLVLIIVRRKHFKLQPKADDLPRDIRFKTAIQNPGTILFVIGCIVLFVASLVF